MKYCIVFCFLVLVDAKNVNEDACAAINCVGEEYLCKNGQCFCANGFVFNLQRNNCVKCPGSGEKCTGFCCNWDDDVNLQCWQGVCRRCYDAHGSWICRDYVEQMVLVSITQIAMGTALILGVLATFILMYKLCSTAADRRPLRRSADSTGRLSVGSLQLYINERLQDVPPRYTRAAPAGSSIYPAVCFLNAGFTHDSSLPPPPYTPQRKNENRGNAVLHM